MSPGKPHNCDSCDQLTKLSIFPRYSDDGKSWAYVWVDNRCPNEINYSWYYRTDHVKWAEDGLAVSCITEAGRSFTLPYTKLSNKATPKMYANLLGNLALPYIINTYYDSDFCNNDTDCEGILVCGINDHCRYPCNGAGSCCSTNIQGYCRAGEGDCDNDDECEGSMKCGSNNCVGYGFSSSDDCCYVPNN